MGTNSNELAADFQALISMLKAISHVHSIELHLIWSIFWKMCRLSLITEKLLIIVDDGAQRISHNVVLMLVCVCVIKLLFWAALHTFLIYSKFVLRIQLRPSKWTLKKLDAFDNRRAAEKGTIVWKNHMNPIALMKLHRTKRKLVADKHLNNVCSKHN